MATVPCESCGVRPAVVAVRHRGSGEERVARLCQPCAGTAAARPGAAAAGPLEGLLEGMLGPPPPGRPRLLGQLSELAQRVLHRAAREALRRGHARVGVELVLLAILQEVPVLRDQLRAAGLDVDGYGARLEAVLPAGPARQAQAVGLSSALKRVFQVARLQATRLGHDLVGPEHLLLGILAEGESFAAQYLKGARPEALRDRLGAAAPGAPAALAPDLPPNLARFSRDLTALARAGELDPVVGREAEVERVIRILSRKTKNNPVLLGEPGVGKTAIVEGLAQRIAAGEVPEVLRGRRVLALDLGGLVAGTGVRGEFEQRVQAVLAELRALAGEVVVFVDELHTLVGAGAAQGAIDASTLLKPALARGELQCLGATTLDEYRRHLEKDAALERRFQPVMVAEPTQAQAVEILRGLRAGYEAHHRVKISDEAIAAAVELSDRYVTDRFLPDKAIDLVDEAAAMVRLEVARAGPRERRGEAEVGTGDVARIVAEWTGIPAARLRREERERLLGMETALAERVVGQEDALRVVAEAVRRARTGLEDPERPIGTFLFLGPTGVGKTETARALAEYLFGDADAMLRLDMSEFQERHTVSRLVGAPPGYVGYEEAGKLTEAVRRRPYCVLLLDEIEKAHPDVLDVLLQVMDAGRLTDAKGRTVSFRNAILILTSNAGAAALAYRTAVGFQPGAGAAEASQREAALGALRGALRPEFLNRLDEVVVFHPLAREQLRGIVERLLASTRRKLRGQGITLAVEPSAVDALVERGREPRFGARPLRRAVQRELETPLSRLLLRGEVREGDHVRVGFAGGAFSFDAIRPPPAAGGLPRPERPEAAAGTPDR